MVERRLQKCVFFAGFVCNGKAVYRVELANPSKTSSLPETLETDLMVCGRDAQAEW